jgi:cytochrome c553
MIIACLLISTSVIAADKDNRQILSLSEAQRGHVLEEMRALLSGTRNILAALSTDDMAAVSKYARPLGLGMAHKAEDHLKGVLPREFMQLGMSLHRDFDQIAADAESRQDPKLTLRQLSDAMTKCVACHDTYLIRTTLVSGQPAQTHEHGHHHH